MQILDYSMNIQTKSSVRFYSLFCLCGVMTQPCFAISNAVETADVTVAQVVQQRLEKYTVLAQLVQRQIFPQSLAAAPQSLAQQQDAQQTLAQAYQPPQFELQQNNQPLILAQLDQTQNAVTPASQTLQPPRAAEPQSEQTQNSLPAITQHPSQHAFLPANGVFFADEATYIGAEVGVVSAMIQADYKFTNDRGNRNAYPKNLALYGAFFGHKFNPRFGLELGYQGQTKKNRTVNLMPGDISPASNIALDDGDAETWQTSSQTQHFNFVAHIVLHEFVKKNYINFWTQVGMSYSKLYAQQYPVILMGMPPTDQQLIDDTNTFKQAKLIPMVAFGINYNWTDTLGFRAAANWRHISMLKPKSQEHPLQDLQVKLKDGFNFSLGIYWRL